MSFLQFKTVFVGDIVAKGLAAIFTVSVVRLLAPAQLAEYVVLSALVVIAATSVGGFFNRHYIVTATNSNAARTYRRWQVGASALLFIVLALVMALESDVFALAAGLLCTVSAAAFDFGRTHTQKECNFKRYALVEIIRVAVLLPLAISALILASVHTVGIVLGAQAMSYVVAGLWIPSLPGKARGMDIPRLLSLFSESTAWHLVAYFILLSIFGQLPILMLKVFGSPYELASFGSAMRYYGLALAVVVAANVVVLPQLSIVRDPAELLTKLLETKAIVFGALALLAVIAVAGYIVIPYLDGGKYPEAPFLFVVLCSALVPGTILAPLTATFFRLGWLTELVSSLLFANIVCGLSALALHHWEALAVAVSLPLAVASQFAILLFLFLKRREGIFR